MLKKHFVALYYTFCLSFLGCYPTQEQLRFKEDQASEQQSGVSQPLQLSESAPQLPYLIAGGTTIVFLLTGGISTGYCVSVAQRFMKDFTQLEPEKWDTPNTIEQQCLYFRQGTIKPMLIAAWKKALGVQTNHSGKLELHSLTPDFRLLEKLLLYPKPNSTILASMANIKDGQGYTTLIRYALLGVPKEIEILLQVPGIDVNATEEDATGDAALHYAAAWSAQNVYALLQDARVSINKKNKSGNTPLHSAVANKTTDAIQALLQHPCIRTDIKNNAGETAAELAQAKGYQAIFEELTKRQPTPMPAGCPE